MPWTWSFQSLSILLVLHMFSKPSSNSLQLQPWVLSMSCISKSRDSNQHAKKMRKMPVESIHLWKVWLNHLFCIIPELCAATVCSKTILSSYAPRFVNSTVQPCSGGRVGTPHKGGIFGAFKKLNYNLRTLRGTFDFLTAYKTWLNPSMFSWGLRKVFLIRKLLPSPPNVKSATKHGDTRPFQKRSWGFFNMEKTMSSFPALLWCCNCNRPRNTWGKDFSGDIFIEQTAWLG